MQGNYKLAEFEMPAIAGMHHFECDDSAAHTTLSLNVLSCYPAYGENWSYIYQVQFDGVAACRVELQRSRWDWVYYWTLFHQHRAYVLIDGDCVGADVDELDVEQSDDNHMARIFFGLLSLPEGIFRMVIRLAYFDQQLPISDMFVSEADQRGDR